MRSDEIENDPVFVAVAKLKTRDVNHRRADALRRRCHGLLPARTQQSGFAWIPNPKLFRESVAPAIVVVWCVAYLLEMIHRAAAVYGF
jgi:hypothetical protein